MSTLPFSFFKQGNQTYEVVDKTARENDNYAYFKKHFANKNILILGDSLSVENTTWVAPFKELAASCNATVDNHSAGGVTSAGALNTANSLTDAYDAAIVWVGINDVYSGVTIGGFGSTGTFADNMRLIFARLLTLNPAMEIYVMGISYSVSLSFDSDKSLYSYNWALKQMANFYGCAFKRIDHIIGAGLQNHNALKSDGNHFTDDYSKAQLFNLFVHKISSIESEEFDETIALSKTLLTPGTNVTLTDSVVVNIIGKMVYMSMLFSITADAPTIVTFPNMFNFGSGNSQHVVIRNINDPSKVYYGVLSGNVIGRGGVAMTAGTYYLEKLGALASNDLPTYIS